ncbi:MAG TPA: tellurite resistance/C4-dicarboxylate transporter family protein, partial [Castellaniella sp.]|nr:tellurite resistance/C4-dicarboxylate transporter family protein [Castellaniella sp.]
MGLGDRRGQGGLRGPQAADISQGRPVANGWLATLAPGYFGLVMATGIISLAAHMMGRPLVAIGLFHLNILQYLVLFALYVWRALRHPRLFFGDMMDHLKGPGYFTLVAGSGVLASQCIVLREDLRMGFVLWVVGVALWLILMYAIFLALTIKPEKPSLDRGINGGWLLAVVATQSVAVSSALLAAHIGQPFRLELNFLALSM